MANYYRFVQKGTTCISNELGVFGRMLVIAGVVSASSHFLPAQDKVPLTNRQSAAAIDSDHLEIEIMEVHRLGAMPNQLRRSGKFVLLLVNRTTDANASFALEPSAAEGAPSSAPLVRWGGPGAWSNKQHASAAIIDQPRGEYQLKSTSTGTVLGTITVEQAQ